MRCVSYCIARSYSLAPLIEHLKSQNISYNDQRVVVHFQELGVRELMADIFVFSHGCFVAWGLTKRRENYWFNFLKNYAENSLENPEVSYFVYRQGAKTKIRSHERFNKDVITIEEEEKDNWEIKLAISYGLAQSVKLEAYEVSIQKTIANNANIPNQLARGGKILLSGRSIAKRIGEIFIERSLVNLNSEFLEVPEYFWEYPHLEAYYVIAEQFSDIPKRVTTLNRKLDVLHEMFDMLNNQLQHRHSSILETVIIILIAIEIIISVVRWI